MRPEPKAPDFLAIIVENTTLGEEKEIAKTPAY
jgi:hypothetical protein